MIKIGVTEIAFDILTQTRKKNCSWGGSQFYLRMSETRLINLIAINSFWSFLALCWIFQAY